MAIIKCKMCGGDLVLIEGQSVTECEYCGSKQTVPAANNEKKLTLFARANRLRASCEFDKAAGVFETIVADFPEEAEAYWGLVLCRYGIEYVDDPGTGKKISTCHRSSFDSIMEDSDFEQALENADAVARRVYREEAKQIEELRKGIIAVSNNEPPYDIFICYKETDENGNRTLDSVLAQDIYDALTEKDYRVFFSRITLEDKLGVEYEPYIFAALNSAKIMLAFGTDYEYFNAVWVKNEWNRYLKLMAKDKEKHLIPCFKGIDAYDMPREFARLQAQDLGKVGSVQDLLRSIDKLLGKGAYAQPQQPQTVIQTSGPTSNSLIKRARLYLEEENWEKVLEYCEQILDSDPESAETYWIQELAQRKCVNEETLIQYYYLNMPQESRAMSYARRFADANMKKVLSCFDTNLQDLEQKQKKATQQRRNARLDDPASQKLYQDIAEARRRIDLLKGRMVNQYYFTVALNQDGKLIRTKLVDDKSGNYGGRIEETEKWPMLRNVCNKWTTIMGIGYDGRVYLSRGRDGKAAEGVPAEEMSRWTGVRELYGDEYDGWFGLKEDGTIVYAADKSYKYYGDYGQGNVSGMRDIEAILDTNPRLICRKKDGTLVATKYTGKDEDESRWPEISKWKNIESLHWVGGRVIGLRKDGTMVATDYKGDNRKEEDKWKEISQWTDVVELHWGGNGRRIYGLDAYGNLMATSLLPLDEDEKEYDPWKKMSGWKGLVSISVKTEYAIGLRYDGSVVCCEWFRENEETDYDRGQVKVSDWTDVVYIDCGYKKTVAVKQDGTLLACGENEHGGCNVDGLKLFDSIDALEENLKNAAETAQKEAEEAQKRRQREQELESKKTAYELYKKAINSKIDREIEEKTAAVRAIYTDQKTPIRREMEQRVGQLQKQRRELSKTQKELQDQRDSLGFFKRREKELLVKEIAEIKRQYNALESEHDVSSPYKIKLEELAREELAEIGRAAREIREANPVVSLEDFQMDEKMEAEIKAMQETARAKLKTYTWYEMAERYYADNWNHFTKHLQPILECMDKKGSVTVSEILAQHPLKNELTNQRVAMFLREAEFKLFYRREMRGGIAYFSIDLKG